MDTRKNRILINSNTERYNDRGIVVKINLIRGILIVLLILTFTVIFNFSSQNREESTGTSSKVTEFLTKHIKLIQKLEPEQREEILEKIEKVVRKLAHFSIYTVVGILMMSLMSTYNIKTMNKIWISLLVGLIYATSDEIHQYFVPGRSAMVTDVLIDTLGVTFGIILVIIAKKLYNLVRKNLLNKRQIKE